MWTLPVDKKCQCLFDLLYRSVCETTNPLRTQRCVDRELSLGRAASTTRSASSSQGPLVSGDNYCGDERAAAPHLRDRLSILLCLVAPAIAEDMTSDICRDELTVALSGIFSATLFSVVLTTVVCKMCNRPGGLFCPASVKREQQLGRDW